MYIEQVLNEGTKSFTPLILLEPVVGRFGFEVRRLPMNT